MFNGLGGLFGWLLIITISGTMLNYFLKLVNKHYGKKISNSPNGKNTMKVLMTIFVRYHRFFGSAARAMGTVLVALFFSKKYRKNNKNMIFLNKEVRIWHEKQG